MNREDLKNYKYNQIWIRDQTEYIETQKETINRLNSILSDMPKGSRVVYDSEIEKLAQLMDYFNELMDKVLEEKEKQKQIVEIINRIEFPYKNILLKHYIQGKKLVTVASEMRYNYEYTKKSNKIALIKFDEECKKDFPQKLLKDTIKKWYIYNSNCIWKIHESKVAKFLLF